MNTKFKAFAAGIVLAVSLFSSTGAFAIQGPVAGRTFCASNPSECAGGGQAVVTVSPDLLATLRVVNLRVNASMRYVNDPRGTDRWNVGGATGDCEDFALTKRRQLIQQGVSASALRLGITYTRRGSAHAVLIVKTSGGEYLLDNFSNRVKPVAMSGYRILAMSGSSLTRWAAI